MSAIIKNIQFLAAASYMRVEQAAHTGILQMVLAFNSHDIEPPDSVLEACFIFLRCLLPFFPHHSVVASFADQIRSLADIEETSKKQSAELNHIWILMKVNVLQQYIITRLFDTFVELHGANRYCNSVSAIST